MEYANSNGLPEYHTLRAVEPVVNPHDPSRYGDTKDRVFSEHVRVDLTMGMVRFMYLEQTSETFILFLLHYRPVVRPKGLKSGRRRSENPGK